MIDAAEMDHLMKLARLHLTDDERARVQGDLNRILGYFEQLSGLDTDGVLEMQRPVDLVNVMRDDTPGEVFPLDTALKLANEQEEGFIRIPRTVEQ